MLKRLLLVYVFAQNAFAAGGGEGHLSELLFPAINFAVLAIFLIVKGRQPLARVFAQNSKEVRELYDIAEKKDKESQIRLEIYQKKIADLNAEKRRTAEKTEKDIRLFQKKVDEETTKTSKQMDQEGVERIENEKKIILEALSESLVDEVVRGVKENVLNDKSDQRKITKRLVMRAG